MSRATTTPVAVALLVGLVVAGAGLLGVVLTGLATPAGGPGPPTVEFDLAAEAGADRIALTHEGGDALAVADLRLRISVAGDPLARQPPVPFFAAEGFVPGPRGPFNSGGDTTWRTGERASLRLAATNRPRLDPGDRVTVTVATDRYTLAKLSTRAR